MSSEGPLSYLGFFRQAPFKTKFKLTFLACLGISACVVSIWVIVQILLLQRPKEIPTVNERKPASTKPLQFAFSYEVKNVSLTITNTNNSRSGYAQFTLVFDMPNEDAKRWMVLNRARLLNMVYEVGGKFFIEDFQAVGGLDLFKQALQLALKGTFGVHSPQQVAITDWVMN